MPRRAPVLEIAERDFHLGEVLSGDVVRDLLEQGVLESVEAASPPYLRCGAFKLLPLLIDSDDLSFVLTIEGWGSS
jgi:hypothetical protein